MPISKDELASLLQPKNFRPLRVHLSQGDSVDISHPKFAHLTFTGVQLLVFYKAGGTEIIDTVDITKVTVIRRRAKRHSKRKTLGTKGKRRWNKAGVRSRAVRGN